MQGQARLRQTPRLASPRHQAHGPPRPYSARARAGEWEDSPAAACVKGDRAARGGGAASATLWGEAGSTRPALPRKACWRPPQLSLGDRFCL
jgi:hypothetical protein